MSCMARLFGMLVMVGALILPSWGQDEKKDSKPDPEKKTADKKSTDKDTATKPAGDKKATDKNKDAKKKAKSKAKSDKPPEEKLEYGQYVEGQLKQLDANSQRDFTVTLMLPDPRKIFDLNLWMQQQLLSQQKQAISVAQQTTLAGRQQALFQYQQQMVQYQVQLAQRETQIYSPKDFELRAADKMKVRTASPPTEYDEKGNMKRWTFKELKGLKKGSKLPGYPAEFDALRANQYVAVYLAKPVLPSAKTTKKGIKLEGGIKLDPEAADPSSSRPEVVMIIVVQEPLPGQR